LRGRFVGILTGLSGLIILVALFRFQHAQAYGDRFLVTSGLLLLFTPLLIILLAFRSEPEAFGFTIGESGRAARFTTILYVLLLLLLIPASQMKVFQARYPIDKTAMESAQAFLYFEATYGLYLFCTEFFFRGFLLFGLGRLLGWSAVFIQAAAFAAMHYGNPSPEIAASFVAALVLGWIALRARSFVPCFLLHWAVVVTFDAMVIGSAHFPGH